MVFEYLGSDTQTQRLVSYLKACMIFKLLKISKTKFPCLFNGPIIISGSQDVLGRDFT